MEAFINYLLRRFAPRVGWVLGLLIFAAATCPALVGSGARIPLPGELLFWGGLGAAMLGLRGGRAPRLARFLLAAPAACLLALALVASLGQALPPADLLWGDLGALAGAALGWLRGAAPPPTVELLSGRFLAASLPRLGRELLAAPGGGERGASLIVATLALAGTVAGAFCLGLGAGARRPTFAWSVPLLVATAAATILSGSNGAGLVIGAAVLLLLALATAHLARERAWELAGAGYSEELRWGTIGWGALGGMFVLGAALALPTAIPSPIARLFQPPAELPSGLAAIEQAVQSGASQPQPTVDVGLSQLPSVPLGVSLEQGPPETLALRVTAPPLPASAWPRYWRARVLSRYNGRSWAADARRGPFYPLAADGPAPAGAIVQEVEDMRPGRGLILAQPDVVGLDVPAVAERLPDGSLAALTGDPPGGRYRAISLPQELAAVSVVTPPSPPPDYSATLALPRALPQRVRELAQAIAGDSPTALERALALERYLRELPYTYTVLPLPEGVDAVDQFLFSMREGYCTYYASAMAVMARSLGIPARVATGYATGEYDQAAGVYLVREADAHAWPELLIDGRWLPFEPTPVRPLPARATDGPPELPTPVPIETADPAPQPLPAWAVAALVGGAMVAVALVGWAALAYRRRYRTVLERAILSLERLGARAGVPWPVGATLHEYAGLVEERVGESRPLRRLVAQIELVRYGGRRLSPDEERRLRSAVAELTDWLRRARR